MNSKKYNETFFILFSNGETIYFNLNSKGEIYCKEFQKIYGENMIGASIIKLDINSFCLKTADGKTIYSLEQYLSALRKTGQLVLPNFENTVIKRLYIDSDVRASLLADEKLIYADQACNIPGLLYEPIETEVKPHTRVRRK